MQSTFPPKRLSPLVIDLSGGSPPRKKTKYRRELEIIDLESSPCTAFPPSYAPVPLCSELETEDSFLAAQLQKIEWEEHQRDKESQKNDAQLAIILQQATKEEEKQQTLCSIPYPTQPNDKTMKASDIAKLYAENDNTYPNLHELFVHFDKSFFFGKLTYVVIKWSYRMKLCAGICVWSSRGAQYEVEIKLSEPLLKFRPRTDMIDTLLHEMIHAFLLITNKEASREDHGPLFKEQMRRVNTVAGTRITIYHSFFDEVNYYRSHWWKCEKCGNVIKRSMNRAPSKNDRWWNGHQTTCGGSFIKFKEPEKATKKEKSKQKIPKIVEAEANPPLSKFFPGKGKKLGAK